LCFSFFPVFLCSYPCGRGDLCFFLFHYSAASYGNGGVGGAGLYVMKVTLSPAVLQHRHNEEQDAALKNKKIKKKPEHSTLHCHWCETKNLKKKLAYLCDSYLLAGVE
jgi:hypothetical protein